MDVGFAAICQLARTRPASHQVLVHRLASLLRASFRPHLAVSVISPLRSLSLHVHHVVKRTCTSKLSIMLGTQRKTPALLYRTGGKRIGIPGVSLRLRPVLPFSVFPSFPCSCTRIRRVRGWRLSRRRRREFPRK